MPKAYTTKELHDAYAQISLERPHECDECKTKQRISHSHLAPKAHFAALATLKDNIVYHCMSMGNTVGCHDQYEGMEVVKMKNFERYFKFLHGWDVETKKYCWLRLNKLEDYWLARDMNMWRKIRAFMAELDKIEHPAVRFFKDENGGDRS